MKKKILALLLVVALILTTLCLTACGGGSLEELLGKGPQGAPGKSAYESWLSEGYIGTEADFLA